MMACMQKNNTFIDSQDGLSSCGLLPYNFTESLPQNRPGSSEHWIWNLNCIKLSTEIQITFPAPRPRFEARFDRRQSWSRQHLPPPPLTTPLHPSVKAGKWNGTPVILWQLHCGKTLATMKCPLPSFQGANKNNKGKHGWQMSGLEQKHTHKCTHTHARTHTRGRHIAYIISWAVYG